MAPKTAPPRGSRGDKADESVIQEFAVFREDVVRCPVRADSLLGVVESVGGHSDDEGDEEGLEPLEKGKARVSWYKSLHNPVVEAVRDLEVVDRAMLHHDIVALASDPLGQSGFVTSVDILCDLRFVSSGREVKGINSRDLIPIQPLKIGGYAVYGGWLGKIEEALDHVIVRFPDEGLGTTVARFSNADPEMLVPLGEGVGNEESPYFPGVRVRATHRAACHARWLQGTMKEWIRGKDATGTRKGEVISLVPGRTVMHWIASSSDDASAQQPSDIIDGTKLTPLTAFMHSWWQLGDYGLYDPPGGQGPEARGATGAG